MHLIRFKCKINTILNNIQVSNDTLQSVYNCTLLKLKLLPTQSNHSIQGSLIKWLSERLTFYQRAPETMEYYGHHYSLNFIFLHSLCFTISVDLSTVLYNAPACCNGQTGSSSASCRSSSGGTLPSIAARHHQCCLGIKREGNLHSYFVLAKLYRHERITHQKNFHA